MQRFHLFEFEDQDWFPHSMREIVTQSLQLMVTSFRVYEAAVPLLARVLERSETRQVVDLCSGAGGPWPQLHPLLRDAVPDVQVTLTDKFPQPAVAEGWRDRAGATYHPHPVDAAAVPRSLPGLRTLFTGFHHFAPDAATALLSDAVVSRAPVAVFESTHRTALNVALAATIGPAAMMVTAPWLRPFRWTHLLWVYLLPAAPIAYAWDGAVSNVRTYTPDELRALTDRADPKGEFAWEIGQIRVPKAPAPITYLVGSPR